MGEYVFLMSLNNRCFSVAFALLRVHSRHLLYSFSSVFMADKDLFVCVVLGI